MNELIELNAITSRIYTIRGVKVMLDRDLAELYEVKTKALKQAVKRQIKRFPSDFMFELTNQEFKDLRSQIVTSSWGGARYKPMAFTEQGLAMLSGILQSDRAIDVNIQIMRAFVKVRQMILYHAELKQEIDELRNQTEERFQIVFEVFDKLLADDESVRVIGFVDSNK